MKLNELINGLNIDVVCGNAACEVSDVTDDSRQVSGGALFIARPGSKTDGSAFVADAVARGAAAVLLPSDCRGAAGIDASVTVLRGKNIRRDTGVLAERFHGCPSQKLKLIGVTGTNGKTTTAHIIQHILNFAGNRCGFIGTVGVDDGTGRRTAELTTPGAVEISRTLKRMVDNGCSACVMEVSSHALDQGRTDALRFCGGVFTNLSGDHLDYHSDISNYAAAKARLFEQLAPDAFAVLNMDDDHWKRMVEDCKAHVLTTAVQAADAVYRATVHDATIQGADVTFHGSWGAIDLRLPLVGRHNVHNALQAATVCHQIGVSAEAFRAALECCTAPPGRLERVSSDGDDVTVLVDYAHTDDALANVLKALDDVRTDGQKLCVVFGCGGDRDRTKRPRMAQAAGRYGDRIYITSDNPRTENPQRIIEDILTGVPPSMRDRVKVDANRRAAIHTAVDELERGAILVIAGKGHENYQIIGTTTRHFDDREVAREALQKCRRSCGEALA